MGVNRLFICDNKFFDFNRLFMCDNKLFVGVNRLFTFSRGTLFTIETPTSACFSAPTSFVPYSKCVCL